MVTPRWTMVVKYGLPAAAVVFAAMTVYHVVRTQPGDQDDGGGIPRDPALRKRPGVPATRAAGGEEPLAPQCVEPRSCS